MKECIVSVSKPFRPVTHVGCGSLYGVIEDSPKQQWIDGIRPPVVGCSPIAGGQQPFGEAVATAARIKGHGGVVQIRFSEFFPGWYDYYGLEDWTKKITWAVRKMQEAKVENIHCYEIWNEPEETWKGAYLVPRTETIDYYLGFRVFVPEDGDYRAALRYANGAAEEFTQWMSVNDGEKRSVSFPSTGGWLAAGACADQVWTLNLKKGRNIIKFSRKQDGYLEMDHLDVCGADPVRYEAETELRGGLIAQSNGFASSKASDFQTFNEFFSYSHRKVRELDPTKKILGPCFAVYTSAAMRNFLSYQKEQGTLPDIICWHQLADDHFTENIRDFRALEKELGIDPRPISINEYSGGRWHDDEGKPGACAPLIAKFERFGIESACQSFWNVPGQLGSLISDEDTPNGGYWFFQWYAEMSGEMVEVLPQDPDDLHALDAFACADEAKGFVSVLFGGETEDGKAKFILNGIPASFGETVCVKVERTAFKGRRVAVSGPETLSETFCPVQDGALTVSLENLNAEDGYRIFVSKKA